MKIRISLYMCGLLFILILSVIICSNSSATSGILVKTMHEGNLAYLQKIVEEEMDKNEIRLIRSDADGFWFYIQVPSESQCAESMEILRSRSRILWVEQDLKIQGARIPNDPYYGQGFQWSLGNASSSLWPPGTNMYGIDAETAWNFSVGSISMAIAILDSGVDCDHEDFSGKCLSGYDFVENDADPSDLNGHGTMVAAIAAANGDNLIGCSGIAWNCPIIPIRVLDADLEGLVSNAANGIDFAVLHGAAIINCSWTTHGVSALLEESIADAVAAGAMVIASTGNDSQNIVSYPAVYSNVIAVGASDLNGNLAKYSNYGQGMSILAPGNSIFNAFFEDSGQNFPYAGSTGTSMAAPHVAGVVALLLDANPGWSGNFIESHLFHTGSEVTLPDARVARRLNAGAALSRMPEPDLRLESSNITMVYDPDSDGFFDPGDRAMLVLTLKNIWGDALDVHASLLDFGQPIAVLTPPQDLDGIAFDAQVETAFLLEASPVAIYGFTYTLQLNLNDLSTGYSSSLSLPITLGGWELVPGPISGTLGLGGSPSAISYRVLGDISIPGMASLFIEPGVTLEFAPAASMQIFGSLLAQGQADSPIRFLPATASPWNGLTFFPTLSPNESNLTACIFSSAETAITSRGEDGGSPTIQDSEFLGNMVALTIRDFNSTIVSGCNFLDNRIALNFIDIYSPSYRRYPVIESSNIFGVADSIGNIRVVNDAPPTQLGPKLLHCNIFGAEPGFGYDYYVLSEYASVDLLDAQINYWGEFTTTELQLTGNATSIYDHLDDVFLSEVDVSGYFTSASESAPPYLTRLTTLPVSPFPMQNDISIILNFNKDMDPSVQPIVTFGAVSPFEDYSVSGNWILTPPIRQWIGSMDIDERFKNAPSEYTFAVSGAKEMGMPGISRVMLTNANYGFQLATGIAGVHTMEVIGKINSIDVSWEDETKRASTAAYTGHIVSWGTRSGDYDDNRVVLSPTSSTTLSIPGDIESGITYFIGLQYFESDVPNPPPAKFISEVEVEGMGQSLSEQQVPASNPLGCLLIFISMSAVILTARRYRRNSTQDKLQLD